MTNQYCIVMTTVVEKDAAGRLTQSLLEAKLAACVQWLDIRSFYTFESRCCNEPEILLLIKTRRALYRQIEDLLKKEHPYKLPEIILVPAEDGLKDYLAWIDAETNNVV